MSEGVLSRTKQHLQKSSEHRFNVGFETAGWQEDGLPSPNTGVILSKDQWIDLGRPEQITITVEPGHTIPEDDDPIPSHGETWQTEQPFNCPERDSGGAQCDNHEPHGPVGPHWVEGRR